MGPVSPWPDHFFEGATIKQIESVAGYDVVTPSTNVNVCNRAFAITICTIGGGTVGAVGA